MSDDKLRVRQSACRAPTQRYDTPANNVVGARGNLPLAGGSNDLVVARPGRWGALLKRVLLKSIQEHRHASANHRVTLQSQVAKDTIKASKYIMLVCLWSCLLATVLACQWTV